MTTDNGALGFLVIGIVFLVAVIAVAVLEYVADRSDRLNDWLDSIIGRLEK